MKRSFVSFAVAALALSSFAMPAHAGVMSSKGGFKSCITVAMNGVTIPEDRAEHFCIYGSIHDGVNNWEPPKVEEPAAV